MPRARTSPDVAVVICTRDRPTQVQATLDALDAQTQAGFPVVVVDQSEPPDRELAARAGADPRITVIRDTGRGLSRARNVAWRATDADWLVFVDDDCIPARDFAEQLGRVLAETPADFVSGHVGARTATPRPDDLPFSTFAVLEEQLFSGRWVHPAKVGFGVCMAVRRSMVDRLGGWDERLGPGVPDFPAADDMDFNFRLLRSGGVVFTTPAVRAQHDQWRARDEIVALYAGYTRAWAGMAVKTAKRGDLLAGLWLWWFGGPRYLALMFASALRRRSRFRWQVAAASLASLVRGTYVALRRPW